MTNSLLSYIYAYLEKIRKVYEHVISRFLLSACNVQAYSHDVKTLSSFGEFVLDGECI